MNKYRLEILERMYTPIYRIIYKSVFPGNGYEGVDENDASLIINVVEQNIELADPILEELVWNLKEDLYHNANNRDRYNRFDENRKVLDHVNYNYNLLRKKLGLPYDYAYFSISERWRMFRDKRKRRISRIDALKEIRRHLERTK